MSSRMFLDQVDNCIMSGGQNASVYVYYSIHINKIVSIYHRAIPLLFISTNLLSIR